MRPPQTLTRRLLRYSRWSRDLLLAWLAFFLYIESLFFESDETDHDDRVESKDDTTGMIPCLCCLLIFLRRYLFGNHKSEIGKVSLTSSFNIYDTLHLTGVQMKEIYSV